MRNIWRMLCFLLSSIFLTHRENKTATNHGEFHWGIYKNTPIAKNTLLANILRKNVVALAAGNVVEGHESAWTDVLARVLSPAVSAGRNRVRIVQTAHAVRTAHAFKVFSILLVRCNVSEDFCDVFKKTKNYLLTYYLA